MLHATAQVIRFEGRRTRTSGRIAIWIALAALPTLLMTTLQSQARGEIPPEPLALISFYMVVQVGCMLGLLLWATPTVGAEVEAQTWIYLAMRPHAKVAILLGKYVVAAVWTASAGIVSAIGVAVASKYAEPWVLARTLIALVCLACVCYSALYSLIGVAIANRATVIAVVYTLVFEGVLSMVPATINKFTICYRLRALLVEWCDLPTSMSAQNLFGNEPVWEHIACLTLYASIVLAIALWIIRTKEYPTSSDN